MANLKVNLDKPHAFVFGHETGAKYEQDGKLFDAEGGEIALDAPAQAQPTGTKPKAPANKEADPAFDALKAKAKELGIKSPHLFKAEALALKIEKAELAALAAPTPPPAE